MAAKQHSTGYRTDAECNMPRTHELGTKTYNPLKVDQVIAQAENTGAEIIRAAQASAYEGYAGYAQDLEASS